MKQYFHFLFVLLGKGIQKGVNKRPVSEKSSSADGGFCYRPKPDRLFLIATPIIYGICHCLCMHLVSGMMARWASFSMNLQSQIAHHEEFIEA